MLVRGLNMEQVRSAIDAANERFEGNIIVKEIEDKSNSRSTITRITVKVKDKDGIGARRSYHAYYMALDARHSLHGKITKPRRSSAACFHAYGAVMVECFKINPDAKIESGSMHLQGGRYKNAAHFLETYRSVGEQNIGSTYIPIAFEDSCNCYEWLSWDTNPNYATDDFIGADGLYERLAELREEVS